MKEIEDIKISLPFDRYDFFGYIFSGGMFAIFLILIFSNFSIIELKHNILNLLIITSDNNIITNFAGMTTLLIILFIIFIMLSYVIGNLIGALSSIFIERFFIKVFIGYPILNILEIKNKSLERDYTYLFYLIFWILLYLKIIVSIIFWEKHSYKQWQLFLLSIILLLALRIIAKWVSLAKNENKDTVWRLPRKIENITHFFKEKILRYILHIAGDFIGISRDLPTDFINKFKKLYNNEFDIEIENSGTESYWLPNIYINYKEPLLALIMNKFLYLLGFARNLSVSFFLLGIISLFMKDLRLLVFPDYTRYIIIVYFALSFLFLIRYYYLYHSFYSKYIIRSFYVLARNKIEIRNKKNGEINGENN